MAELVTTIAESNQCITFINSFSTSSHQQQEMLVKMLVDNTEKVMKHQAGFISVNIHKSYDATNVLIYEQWRSTDDLRAATQIPEVVELIAEICKLSNPEATLYNVVSVSHAADDAHSHIA
jgi:quinol monooxygenase YgiN